MSEATPKSLQNRLWEVWFPVHIERCRGFDSAHLILFIMVVFFSYKYFKDRLYMTDDDIEGPKTVIVCVGEHHEKQNNSA